MDKNVDFKNNLLGCFASRSTQNWNIKRAAAHRRQIIETSNLFSRINCVKFKKKVNFAQKLIIL